MLIIYHQSVVDMDTLETAAPYDCAACNTLLAPGSKDRHRWLGVGIRYSIKESPVSAS
jgi:hypothetical protein